MTFARAFAGTLVAFLAIDLPWISRVAGPMYERQIGPLLRSQPQMGAAAGFYLAYAAGIVYFAVLPALRPAAGIGVALRNGGILGGLAYGTFAFTNYAVLEGWTFKLVVADVAWGIVLTALTAACGLFVARLKDGPEL